MERCHVVSIRSLTSESSWCFCSCLSVSVFFPFEIIQLNNFPCSGGNVLCPSSSYILVNSLSGEVWLHGHAYRCQGSLLCPRSSQADYVGRQLMFCCLPLVLLWDGVLTKCFRWPVCAYHWERCVCREWVWWIQCTVHQLFKALLSFF